MDKQSEKIELHFEIANSFFEEIHTHMGLEGREPDAMLHIRNALELYATVIEGMVDGKIPSLVDPQGRSAQKIFLPSLLSQFKYEKEMEHDSAIDLKKQLL